jgi:hypothetical protein
LSFWVPRLFIPFSKISFQASANGHIMTTRKFIACIIGAAKLEFRHKANKIDDVVRLAHWRRIQEQMAFWGVLGVAPRRDEEAVCPAAGKSGSHPAFAWRWVFEGKLGPFCWNWRSFTDR